MTMRDARVVTIQESQTGDDGIQLTMEAPVPPSLGGATLKDSSFRGSITDLEQGRVVAFHTTLENLRALKRLIDEMEETAIESWESYWGNAQWVGQKMEGNE